MKLAEFPLAAKCSRRKSEEVQEIAVEKRKQEVRSVTAKAGRHASGEPAVSIGLTLTELFTSLTAVNDAVETRPGMRRTDAFIIGKMVS